MIRILIGPKGAGKTKVFINMVNEANKTEKGNVVCITKGDRHTFDISSGVRLVNIDEFDVTSAGAFYGFLCGMISQNYDITHIFIDSITKIARVSLENANEMIPSLEKISEKFSVDFTISISADREEIPENIIRHQVEL